MKRTLVLIGLVASLVAACGGGGGDADVGAGTAPPPAPPASAASSPAATIAGPDGASLQLPEGALAAPAPTVRLAKDASAAPPLPAVFAPAGDVFVASPDGTALQVLGTLRIPVDPATPDDTPVAIAESNAEGGWTLRTDARIDGGVLQIEVARLGHYRVVKPATGLAVPSPKTRALAATGGRLLPWTTGIRLASPGYGERQEAVAGEILAVLRRPEPYLGNQTVAFTAERTGSAALCDQASAIRVDYRRQVLQSLQGIGSETTPIAPARGGPWAFELHLYRGLSVAPTVYARVTVTCVDPAGATYAITAAATIRYDIDNSAIDLALSAPGFRNTSNILGPIFESTSVLPYASSVPLTVAVRSPAGRDAGCVAATSIVVEHFDPNAIVGTVVAYRQTAPIAPPHPGPWTIDLQTFRPTAGTNGTLARVNVNCVDAGGAAFTVTGRQTVVFTVASEVGVGFFAHPVDASAPLGRSAAFTVRVGGGPDVPTDRDHYRLFWEQSRDDGGTWRTVATAYQTDVARPSAGDGRSHAITLGELAAADNGSLVRARACYAPPGSIERCVQSRSARLTVAQSVVAPTITRQPRAMSTLVGETAGFDVAVAGTPAPTVRWQLLASDQTTWLDVGTASAWPGTSGSGTTLVTPPGTLAAPLAVLRAVVANAGGEVASNPVVWRVTETVVAPAITVQPLDAGAPSGGRAVFAVAAEGTAPLSYRWFKDGAAIAGANAAVLALDAVSAADVARYRVVVSGPGGSATSRDAALSIVTGPALPTPPQVAVQPTPQTVPLGRSATFAVTVAGGPPLFCQWLKNGVAVAGATSCTGHATPPVQAGDNGAVYNVVAWNAGGTAFAGGALLTVQGAGTPSGWRVLPSSSATLIGDIALVGGSEVAVFVAFDGRIHRTTDGGASWSVVHVPTAIGQDLAKVRFVDAHVGLAVGPETILRSADGGATWQEVLKQGDVDPLVGGVAQRWQAVDWVDPMTAVVASLNRLWISTDRGLTWQLHGSFDFGTLGLGVVHAVRFAGPTGFAASDFRLLRTGDFGLTWSDAGAPNTFFTDPLYGVEGENGNWVAVGGEGIYRSTDNGLHWARQSVTALLGRPGYLSGMRGRGSEMVAVGQEGVVLSTNSAGVAWTVQPSLGFGYLFATDFIAGNGNRPIFVAGVGGVVARLD